MSISSNPPGALIWVNDREIGRTPVSFNFTYHGEYDIR
ncbi:MAG: PEGA domain-containing protein, partial [Deltaproteobacteria bacterium]|nr:PEGA domain-containing protein [Deltaproteobacteria bacterium]